MIKIKLDRLLGILTILLQNDIVTAPYLAERFEVSRRTISRDIDALGQAGIPVRTRQGGNGGISIAEGYKLDKSVLTADELASISAGLKGLGSVSDAAKTLGTLDKFSHNKDTVVSLRESIVIDLASHYKGSLTKKIEFLKEAIRENRRVTFHYYYEKGEVCRDIEPYFIVFQWNGWYVFGYCLTRQDWRLFKLGRLWQLACPGDTFTPREIPPERKDFNACYTDHLKLKALFSPSTRYQLMETYGFNCYTETADGLLAEIHYTNEDYMVAWLLSFGGKVKVLEPVTIREKIKDAARAVLNHYDT